MDAMARYDFRSPRLFVEATFAEGAVLPLAPNQANYLLNVLRQKPGEMGASRLQPVIMRHTQAERINLGRMRANVVEAAEQCGILTLPEIAEPRKLDAVARGWKADRLLVFCDEEADVRDPVAALSSARGGGIAGTLPVSLLVGPEGGFAEGERAAILK